MPANKKYLTQSKWQRFAKITAGFLGGYLVTIAIHMAVAVWFGSKNTVITMSYSGFILWAALLIIAFIPKNGWKTWSVYLVITELFSAVIYLGK